MFPMVFRVADHEFIIHLTNPGSEFEQKVKFSNLAFFVKILFKYLIRDQRPRKPLERVFMTFETNFFLKIGGGGKLYYYRFFGSPY